MNASDRSKLARLESVLRDLDWREQLAVKELEKAGWGFASVKSARDYLARFREAERVKRAAQEVTDRMLREARGWMERSNA